MEIVEMIMLAYIRNEIELAEILKDCLDDDTRFISDFADYQKSDCQRDCKNAYH